MANTIVIKGSGVRSEAIANAAITPGHLLQLMSTGKVRKHATAGQAGNVGPRAFAIEDELQGNGIGTDYDTGDLVQYNVMLPGDEVYAILKDGISYSIGDMLESSGNGTLMKHVADEDSTVGQIFTDVIVGICKEALDLTGSAGEEPTNHCRVEII